MRSISPINISVVVAASSHNPSILHPSFLENMQIIPSGWTVKEGPICTPAFSLVSFENGVEFQVDEKQLRITCPESVNRSDLSKYATKYLNTLPHVTYTGVGVNFTSFWACEDSDRFLVNRYIQRGPWNDDSLFAVSTIVNLAYKRGDWALRLTLRPNFKRENAIGPVEIGVLIESNCHENVTNVDEAKLAISQFDQKLDYSLTSAETVILNQ